MSPTVAAAAAAAAMDAAAVAKQAEQLRQEGNFCFKKDRFGAAIDAYTEVNPPFCIPRMNLHIYKCIHNPGTALSFILHFPPSFGWLFRRLHCALMWPYIGQIVLCVIGGASMYFSC